MTSSARSMFSPFWIWVLAAVGMCWYLFTFQDGRIVLRPNRINFGIDLVGGTYIRLKVQTDKAVEAELGDKSLQIINNLENQDYAVPVSRTVTGNNIVMKFETVDEAQKAIDVIKGMGTKLVVSQDRQEVRAAFRDNEVNRIEEAAVRGNIDVLRNRLDAIGVGEITIAQQGKDSIIVELPDVNDPQQAKAMIGKTAQLEFKIVEAEAGSEDDLLDRFDGELPDHLEMVRHRSGRPFYAVEKYAEVTGKDLRNASAGLGGSTGTQVVVKFEFKPEGGDRFHQLTSKNLRRNLAIIVDDVVISAPYIKSAIPPRGGIIEGEFTIESATELATMIKSGSFVAPVTFEEERQVGPSLGQESIRKGLLACGLALGLLVIFGILLYKVAGFFAFLALMYNLLLIMAILSWLGATLSLPGIAGMVLTVGMAIDASILIYERIKEELAAGITTRKAVSNGFKDAMTVILDSNITTFLVGIVLYKFGTGPIQGFAVTMMVGIISTLITGLFFLRSIFNYALYNLGMQNIRI